MRSGIPRAVIEDDGGPMDEPTDRIRVTVTHDTADMIRVLLASVVVLLEHVEDSGIPGIVIADGDDDPEPVRVTMAMLRDRLDQVSDLFDPESADTE